MLNRDFKEFAELLDARGVDYLVVGSYALAARGHPRYTGNIDFWVRPTPDNIARLLLVLHDFGFGSLGLTCEDFTTATVTQLGQPPRRIDLPTAIDGVAFDACFARRKRVDLAGVNLQSYAMDPPRAPARRAQAAQVRFLPVRLAS